MLPGLSSALMGTRLTPPFSFRAVYSTTNDGTHSFLACDLGTPDPSRMIVVLVAMHKDSASVTAVTVDGVAGTQIVENGTSFCKMAIWTAPATANPTGTITITITDSQNCSIGVYAGYPNSQTPVDFDSATGSGSTLLISNLAKTSGGFTVYGVKSNADISHAVTQTGVEAVSVDGSAAPDGRKSSFGHHLNTATTSTDDYTATLGSASQSAFAMATWL